MSRGNINIITIDSLSQSSCAPLFIGRVPIHSLDIGGTGGGECEFDFLSSCEVLDIHQSFIGVPESQIHDWGNNLGSISFKRCFFPDNGLKESDVGSGSSSQIGEFGKDSCIFVIRQISNCGGSVTCQNSGSQLGNLASEWDFIGSLVDSRGDNFCQLIGDFGTHSINGGHLSCSS